MTEETQPKETQSDEKPIDTSANDTRIAELQAEVERLRKHNETVLSEKKAEQAAARKAAEEAAAKSGDVEALKSSYEQKFNETKAEYEARIDGLSKSLTDMTVTRAATELASDLAVQGSAKALLPHIQARLKMELDANGVPTIAVVDNEGKPSALSLADLRKEIESDTAFAPLLAGTKASGGGAAGSKNGAGGASHVKGNLAGTVQERRAAIKQRFNL